MDAQFWKRVNELFDQALDQPADQRDTFLKEACGDDPALSNEVRALLEADRASQIVLDGGAADAVGLTADQAAAGDVIGPYRVVRTLGAGGMGDVYLAERADGHFEQQVALKLIKRGMDSKEILQRFSSERQILAGLQHPHIGRLLDGGSTDDGRPFYAMEYVDGEPITEYCDRKRLTVEQRLQLFGDVCDAVRYAQERFVVHRDLKPSNILVTGDGVVKLLDFGIAKVLEGESLGATPTDATRTGMRIMTPAYAAPEQMRGESATTATDVYALGIILYELLTGRRPFKLEGLSAREIEDLIASSEPTRPSQEVTSPEPAAPSEAEASSPEQIAAHRSIPIDRLRKRLSGDLDNICLMALRKDPQRRYHSAAELQRDISRHLDGHTVQARPDALAYRLQKFLGRHKVGVAAVTAVLVVAASLITFYTAQLADERDRARQEAAKAASVSEFLGSLFELADPTTSRGEEVTARDMLEQGARRIRDELSTQPQVQAQMLIVIGNVYRNLGLYEEARTAVEEALAIRLALFGDNHPDVAEAYSTLATIVYYAGQIDSSLTLAEKALGIRREHHSQRDTVVATELMNLGWIYSEQSEFEAAESLFTEALAIRRAAYGDEHPDVAESISGLASVAYNRGEHQQSERLCREALEMRQRTLGELHPDLVSNLNDLGLSLEQLDRLEEAEAAYKRSLEISKQLWGEDHHSADANAYLGRINIGYELYHRAEPYFREALRLRKIGLVPDHFLIGYDWKQLGDVLLHRQNIPAADTAFDSALAIFRANSPDADAYMASALLGKGRTLVHQGQFEEGEAHIREGLRSREELLGPDHWVTASARVHLGWALVQQGRYEEAEELLVKCYAKMVDVFGPEERKSRGTARRLAELYDLWGKPDLYAHYHTLAGERRVR